MPIALSDLIGKRVRHKCHDSNCPLKGLVQNVVYWPQKTLHGEHSDYWAIVRWNAYGNVPNGYTQPVPIHKVEVIS